MLLYVQALTAKGCPKFIVIEKQEREKQLSGYKHTNTHTKIKEKIIFIVGIPETTQS